MLLKKRIAAGEVTVGAWCTVAHPQVVEVMASTAGIDWVVFDLEHTELDEGHLVPLFLACERHGATPLVRLSSHDPIQGRRALDLGAAGLLVPVVESVETFASLARHFYYPPRGRRGACLARVNAWGERFATYQAEFAPILIPQIETPEGVGICNAIAALPEVDAIFVGPYDLSASLGAAGDFETPAFRDAERMVLAAGTSAGKALGIHVVTPEATGVRRRLNEGYRFVALGTDMICMREGLRAAALCRG
jgi:2-keto-3-deoxy-L-rhamnonate aldolase RhmA